jgi:hypothetical protein
MMVEKVPDSTYEMVGGLDKQIKEIKEVIELPVKHPELFEALGIAQPKVRKLQKCPLPRYICDCLWENPAKVARQNLEKKGKTKKKALVKMPL